MDSQPSCLLPASWSYASLSCSLSTSPFVWGWYSMVHSHLIPRILQSSSIMLLIKLDMQPPHRNLAMAFAVWSGVTYISMCLVKWSWKTNTLVILGNWFSFNLVSILVKSTCKRFRGVVATMGHKVALEVPPSYWRQHLQALITCLICLAISGNHGLDVLHLNGTCSRQQSGVYLTPQRVTDPYSPFWHGAQIDSVLEGSEILMISPDHPALLTWSVLPEECPSISFLLRLQPLQICI